MNHLANRENQAKNLIAKRKQVEVADPDDKNFTEMLWTDIVKVVTGFIIGFAFCAFMLAMKTDGFGLWRK